MGLRLLVLCLAILSIPSTAILPKTVPPQAQTSDPQAVTILQQSVKAMGGAVPTDSLTTGTVQVTAGGQTNQGSVRILTKGTSESLVQMSLPEGTRTIVYVNGKANELLGTAVQASSLELAASSQAAEFPLPLLAAILSNADSSVRYIGEENSGGHPVQHVQAWNSFASQPALQSLAAFSLRDIWIDAATGFVERISYRKRAAGGAVFAVAVDVFFSNYQSISGVAYPYSVQESLDGTAWATITIQNVSFNAGLTDTDFPLQ